MDFKKEREALEARMLELEIYEGIRERIVDRMNWDCMKYHSADDEHECTWFTEPEDEYSQKRIAVYKNLLDKLDKFISKN